MIELGGNIKLVGFEKLEPSKLIVVKKMIGNYAKKISDSITPFQELILSLNATESSNELIAKIVTKDLSFESKALHNNLFFSIDNALNSLTNQLKK